jgi:N-acetylglucosaminyldiphosphoundecaprenol N-acetyl-beta-D-mannosaminyltransferase
VALPVKSPANRVNVLGVGVDPLRMEDLHAEIGRLVRRGVPALVLNANVHCLNLCYKDHLLRNFLNRAEVVFCDGAGVMLAARILGGRIPQRITYADWSWQLAAFAAAQGFSLYFLGARPGVAEEAARRLKRRYPALKIAGIHHGYFDHSAGSPQNEAVLEEINASSPDILLVGLGMPLQEYWLMENRHRLDAGVVLTGGAVFDYASGRLRRGPRLLTESGFEWLARLLIEPRRLWRRYLLGNPLFFLRVLKQALARAR